MKGIAVAIFPHKEDLLISYTELEAKGIKDEIRVGKNETLEVVNNGKETICKLTSKFIDKASTVVPVVFGMHACFELSTEKLHEAARNIFGNLPVKSQLYCRTFFPLRDLSDAKIDEKTIYAMNEVFRAKIDFDHFTPEQDVTLERMAKLWVSVLDNDRESRFVGILPDDKYLIAQILKKGGKWRERFGTHVCRQLGAKRNICVKPLGHNKNPPFSDVTATYIADILDLQTGEDPRIVEAIR